MGVEKNACPPAQTATTTKGHTPALCAGIPHPLIPVINGKGIDKDAKARLEKCGVQPCSPHFTEVDVVTICEPIPDPTAPDTPHAVFPRQTRPKFDAQPTAPIVYNSMTGGNPINVLQAQYRLRASVADTNCRQEVMSVIYPAGFSTNPVVSYASDVQIMVVTGTLLVTINGTPYTLGPGGYALIKKGSVFAIANDSATVDASFFIVSEPGFAGAYADAGLYQTSVGGASNVDLCVLEQIFAKYGILPAQGYSLCVNGVSLVPVPNTTRFVPSPNAACGSGTWGIGCGQLLVLTVNNPVPPTAGVTAFTKPSATIHPSDLSAYVVAEGVTTLQLSAVVVRDPAFGSPDVLATPTVNGLTAAPILAAANYYVEYSEANNNVTVRPLLYLPVSV